MSLGAFGLLFWTVSAYANVSVVSLSESDLERGASAMSPYLPSEMKISTVDASWAAHEKYDDEFTDIIINKTLSAHLPVPLPMIMPNERTITAARTKTEIIPLAGPAELEAPVVVAQPVIAQPVVETVAPVEVLTGLTVKTVTQEGIVTKYVYDANNQILKSASGMILTDYRTQNGKNEPFAETEYAAPIRSFKVDKMGHLLEVTLQDGTHWISKQGGSMAASVSFEE